MLDIVIATRNRHKFRELKKLLNVAGVRWHSLEEFESIPSIRETAKSFDANAVKKARLVAKLTGFLALADDSGIEVESLGWMPGVRSARFAGSHGDDHANNEKLLHLLRGLPMAKRRARYRCSLALSAPSKLIALTRGSWQGHVAFAPKGKGGFGYDPVFRPPHLGKTVGELPVSVKQKLSHRAKAAFCMRSMLKRLAACGVC